MTQHLEYKILRDEFPLISFFVLNYNILIKELIVIQIPKCEDVILKYNRVRDIPYSWLMEEEWRSKIYSMWNSMWHRVNKHPSYKDSKISENYSRLSNYFEDVLSLENFDLFKENPKGWSIDKDIKIKDNKDYYFEALSLVTLEDNTSERNIRKGYPNSGNFKPIIGINKDTIILLKSRNEAKEKGFRPSNITLVCQGKRPHHKGYKWFYINYKHNKTYRRV